MKSNGDIWTVVGFVSEPEFFDIFLEIFGLHLQKKGKRPIKIILKYSVYVYLCIFHILTPMTANNI